ncbi:hypothetical protein ACSHWB_41365 [Lentzea sp. HUAS TT2]|uniref:hypothetical protein n=1 Tax=Lentzea sp. HUAS TT2 TaxID=3447454 RepID=UPI003F73122C
MTEPTDGTTELFARLQALDLSEEQRRLLAAILNVAGCITDGEGRPNERAFHEDFEQAFTPYSPATVALLLASADCPPPPAATYEMVTRAMVVRGLPPSGPTGPILVPPITPPPPPPPPPTPPGPAHDDD